MLWYDSITINAGQTFAVTIGKGGEAATRKSGVGAEGKETTFGVYSSANGKRYANGYTDINSGDSYARTPCREPATAGSAARAAILVPGTGNRNSGRTDDLAAGNLL